MEPSLQQYLGGLNIAVLVNDGFAQGELVEPLKALQEAGAQLKIVSARAGKVRGRNGDQPGDEFDVALRFDQASADDFDAALLPGGSANADSLRHDAQAQRLVGAMDRSGKPIAAICHGGLLLVSAGLARGRTMTGWPGFEKELSAAGGKWADQDVVVDGNWISSRGPADLPAFIGRFKQVLAKRVKRSVSGSADALPGAAATGG